MSAYIHRVGLVDPINSGLELGYNCFVCNDIGAGNKLTLLSEPVEEGKKLTDLFNKTVPNSACLDNKDNPYYIQVKIHACNSHHYALENLRKLIVDSPSENVNCCLGPESDHRKTHTRHTLTEATIISAKNVSFK